MSRALWVYGGGSSADLDAITATASDVLSGKVIVDKEGEPLTGTMPNRGAVSQTLNCGQTYTIPAGYHTGSGKIVANSLASQTSATATAAAILKGKTAWVNGSRITGTIPSHAAGSFNPDLGKSKTIIAAGNYLQNPVVLNPFVLPPANKLVKGYTYSIYGHSVTGTAAAVPQASKRYLIQNGRLTEAAGDFEYVVNGGNGGRFQYRSGYIWTHTGYGSSVPNHTKIIFINPILPLTTQALSIYNHVYLRYYAESGPGNHQCRISIQSCDNRAGTDYYNQESVYTIITEWFYAKNIKGQWRTAVSSLSSAKRDDTSYPYLMIDAAGTSAASADLRISDVWFTTE